MLRVISNSPTLIILLAGLIVSFAAVPLQITEWAEGFRTSSESEGRVAVQGADGAASAEGMAPAEGDARQPGGVAMIFLPLVKVMVIMGIGGLLTALVLWIMGRIKRGNVLQKA